MAVVPGKDDHVSHLCDATHVSREGNIGLFAILGWCIELRNAKEREVMKVFHMHWERLNGNAEENGKPKEPVVPPQYEVLYSINCFKLTSHEFVHFSMPR